MLAVAMRTLKSLNLHAHFQNNVIIVITGFI